MRLSELEILHMIPIEREIWDTCSLLALTAAPLSLWDHSFSLSLVSCVCWCMPMLYKMCCVFDHQFKLDVLRSVRCVDGCTDKLCLSV